jgi:hypothetical protein
LAKWLREEGRNDAYGAEALAFSLVASEQYAAAAAELRELAKPHPADAPWMAEIRHRAGRLSAVLPSDPRKAQALLEKWQRDTAAALGLTKLL